MSCKWATSCRDNVERFQERARDNKEMTKCTLSALPMYSLSLAMVSGYSWVEGWYSNSITIRSMSVSLQWPNIRGVMLMSVFQKQMSLQERKAEMLVQRTLVTEKLVGIYLAGVTIRAPQWAHLSHHVLPIGPETTNREIYLSLHVLAPCPTAKKRSVCFCTQHAHKTRHTRDIHAHQQHDQHNQHDNNMTPLSPWKRRASE